MAKGKKQPTPKRITSTTAKSSAQRPFRAFPSKADISDLFGIDQTSIPPLEPTTSRTDSSHTKHPDDTFVDSTGAPELGDDDQEELFSSSAGPKESDPHLAQTWPAVADKHLLSGKVLLNNVLSVVWLIWLGVILWLLLQDNGNQKLDTLDGILKCSAKGLYVTFFCLFVSAGFIITHANYSRIVKFLIAVVILIVSLGIIFAVLFIHRHTPKSEKKSTPSTEVESSSPSGANEKKRSQEIIISIPSKSK